MPISARVNVGNTRCCIRSTNWFHPPPTASGEVSPMYSKTCTPRTELTPFAPRVNKLAITKTGVLNNNSDAVAEVILPNRSPSADDNADHRPEHRTDDEKPQADPDSAAELRRDGLARDGRAEVTAHCAGCPLRVTHRNRLVQVQFGLLRLDHLLGRAWVARFEAVERFERKRCESKRQKRRQDQQQHVVEQASRQEPRHRRGSPAVMRTGYEMPPCEAANATGHVASQFLPGLKPSYRNREFTGFYL